ncbi:hypothetical protein NDU88_000847 [Pleurodeles waltl]|uniref:Uncharacterized protein n=1 Tax=Pleurodeles waltl TaxID=8319 RepID=A0AAV7U8R1_PLEWA|nr:hypothetical protein NDU88_000847 [Pleurodeles waltl]
MMNAVLPGFRSKDRQTISTPGFTVYSWVDIKEAPQIDIKTTSTDVDDNTVVPQTSIDIEEPIDNEAIDNEATSFTIEMCIGIDTSSLIEGGVKIDVKKLLVIVKACFSIKTSMLFIVEE